MNFSSRETLIVAGHLLSNNNTLHTINNVITDLLSMYEVHDSIVMLSNNLKSMTEYELLESIKESSTLTGLLARTAFDNVNFDEIADYLISDRIAVG